jgi:transposase
MKHYVGLDVSMKETSICIIDEQGKIVYEGREFSDPLRLSECLKARNIHLEKVGIESGAISQWLVTELQKEGIPAICIDARQMAAVLSTNINKTDPNDARGIARALRSEFYREVLPKSSRQVDINVVLASRKALVMQRTNLKNTIRGLLKSYGIRLSTSGEKSFYKEVKEKILEKAVVVKEALEALLIALETVSVQIEKLKKSLELIAKEDKDIAVLTTIPGVGLITALSFKATIGDPNRFKDSRDVGAYLGLTPKQYSSGEVERQGRISRCGSMQTRTLLVEAATVMLSRTKLWSKPKAWALKLQRKKGFRKATVALARKLAVIMHKMLITKKNFVLGDPVEEKQAA